MLLLHDLHHMYEHCFLPLLLVLLYVVFYCIAHCCSLALPSRTYVLTSPVHLCIPQVNSSPIQLAHHHLLHWCLLCVLITVNQFNCISLAICAFTVYVYYLLPFMHCFSISWCIAWLLLLIPAVLLGCIGSKYLTDIAYNFHWLIYRKWLRIQLAWRNSNKSVSSSFKH